MKFALKLALTCIALWLAFRNVAWSELNSAFVQQDHAYLLAALLAIGAQTVCGGMRWHGIRRVFGSAQSAGRTALIYFASNFFNVCLPSTVGGDVARVWLAKHGGGTMKDSVYGVLIDRIVSLGGLALLVASTLPFLFPYLGLARRDGLIAAALCWALSAVVYALLARGLPRLPHTRFALLNDTLAALRLVIGRFAPLAGSLLWAAAAHLCYATAAYALALSLGAQIDWLACAVLVPLVLFVSTLPISVGGWGIREMGMTGMLALAGVAKASALVLSIQLGLLTALVGMAGGLYYLRLRKP